jgi:hypothetical protein
MSSKKYVRGNSSSDDDEPSRPKRLEREEEFRELSPSENLRKFNSLVNVAEERRALLMAKKDREANLKKLGTLVNVAEERRKLLMAKRTIKDREANLKKLEALVDFAEERRRSVSSRRDRKANLQYLQNMVSNAEQNKRLGRTTRRSFERYEANVPFVRRSSSSRRVSYHEPLEVIEVPAINSRETDFQRNLRLARERVIINPNAPQLVSNTAKYIPKSFFGTQSSVMDRGAIEQHLKYKQNKAARTIQRAIKKKQTRKRGSK